MDHEYSPNPAARKFHRRRRKFQGATWTPRDSNANFNDGEWCRACRTTHGYSIMKISYERRGQAWVLLWKCHKTENVLKEMWLG